MNLSQKMSFKVSKKLNNEREFTSRFGSEIKKRGWFFHKISDMDIRPKPFDAILSWDGIVCGIEFKCTKSKKCRPYRMLRWSSLKNTWPQVKGLTEYQENGWLSLVIVFNKVLQQYKVIDFVNLWFNSQIIFDA